jgi:hypothetical protein
MPLFRVVLAREILFVLDNGVNFNNNYLIIAFLCWVPNLILAEIINRYGKRPVLVG